MAAKKPVEKPQPAQPVPAVHDRDPVRPTAPEPAQVEDGGGDEPR